MLSVSEMNKKIEISIGLVLALIVGTFLITSFYIEVITIESRMDSRYNRILKKFDKLENEIRTIHSNEIKKFQ